MTTRILLFCTLILSVSACNKEDEDKATINYYMTSTVSTTFSHIQFRFDYIRAIYNDGKSSTLLTINPQLINLDLKYPSEVFLGTSQIATDEIDGYDFRISEVRVVKDQDTINLVQPLEYSNYANADLNLSKGEIVNINLVLDVDASTTLDAVTGENLIKPQVVVE